MPAAGRRVSAVATLLLLALSAGAQTTPLTAGETIEVSIVNVDVFVTDREGNRVRGLTAADFEIREDGKPQPITNFAEYAGDDDGEFSVEARTRTAAAPSAAAAPEKRTIVVFLESMTLAPFRSKPVFDSIRSMLRQTVRPGDSVAIVSWHHAALVRQDFTDDLDSLERALDEIEAENTGVEGNPAEAVRRRIEFAKEFQRELVEAGYPIGEAADTTFHALSTAQAELFEIRQKSFALRSYMEAIAGFEGKKIVIMSTERFGQYAGADYFGGEVPFRYRAELDTRVYREAVIATANANNITIYPIFARGLGWNSHAVSAAESGRGIYRIDSDGDLRRFASDNYSLLNETSSLDEIADETGGMLAWGSKDVAKLMPRIAEDLESYYSLGYRAPATGRDDSRDIRVVAKNRNYVVRSRREYVEKSDDTRMTDLVIANLVRPDTGSRLPIEVEVGKITNHGRRRAVPLKIRVPIDALSKEESGGEFSVYLAAGGAFGIISEVDRKTQRYTIDQVRLATVDDAAFTYDVTFDIERAAYRLSVGVFDEISRDYGLAHIELPLEEER
ncbi:MAG TPA: VWA domain-containing protein [Thermoanaerobaculia bacterium]|jgi:VWFA-related protein